MIIQQGWRQGLRIILDVPPRVDLVSICNVLACTGTLYVLHKVCLCSWLQITFEISNFTVSLLSNLPKGSPILFSFLALPSPLQMWCIIVVFLPR